MTESSLQTGEVDGLAPRGLRGWWREQEAFRKANMRPGMTLYSALISYRLGALVARPLARTRVTANQLTLVAMAVTVATSAAVIAAGRVTAAVLVAGLVGWQLGYGLDCADGQLARARRQASPFGAWLDQCADFVAHVSVLTAMAVVVSHAGWMGTGGAAALAGLTCGANLFTLFATSQYNSLLGPAGPAGGGPPAAAVLRRLASLRHLIDYGAFVLIAALCLDAPVALLVVLVAAGVLNVLAVTGQIALNWRAAARL